MLSRKSLFTSFSGLLNICRHAHNSPSSRLHTAERRRFRAPKTYTYAGSPVKNSKPAKVPKPPKTSRRRAIPKEQQPKPTPPERLVKAISTFNPEKLAPCDWIDLSARYSVFPHLKYGGKREANPIYYGKTRRYPPHAKGFFYFSRPEPLPHSAAGHLRFRVVPEADPTVFPSGHDLLDSETGIAWEKHLIHMKLNRTDRHLYDAILNEGMITPEEDCRITEMLAKVFPNRARGARAQVLDSILDPFLVDFSKVSFQLIVAEPDRIYEINHSHRWASDKLGPRPSPYSGIGLCRFVLLNRDASTKRLGILLVKYVMEPSPSDALKQVEGALVNKYSFVFKKETPVVKSVKLLSEHSYRVLLECTPPHSHL